MKTSLAVLAALAVLAVAENQPHHQQPSLTTAVPPTDSTTSALPATQGRRPSLWSKSINHVRRGGRRPSPWREVQLRRSTEMRPIRSESSEENAILNSDAMLSLKDFANQLVNDTAAYFKAAPQPR